jgi:hypothetical protein
VSLERWADVGADGWFPAEEHLHYDRLDPAHDADWLTMLAGDDLAQAHFLVLKGGNLPGVWATQFAYGAAGEAFDGERLIRPGEEYRDTIQGHINLLGISEVIPPISTGGTGRPKVAENYPPFVDVLRRARKLGGIGGPAHGTALGRSPTGILDTILGAVDFFEIANTHLYKVDVWYRLMNCGYLTPPAAGTDLPNFPFREPWQPLLGETRMYVRVGPKRDFKSWTEALKRGEVFVTSGPMIRLTVNGTGPGGTVRLSAGGGEVHLEAELAGPRPLQTLELVRSGEVIASKVHRQKDGKIHRWRIQERFSIEKSSWLAARGTGVAKRELEKQTGIRQNTVAHTAAVRVLVGDGPIASPDDVEFLAEHLSAQREYYRTKANFERDEHRKRVLGLFDTAIAELARGE